MIPDDSPWGHDTSLLRRLSREIAAQCLRMILGATIIGLLHHYDLFLAFLLGFAALKSWIDPLRNGQQLRHGMVFLVGTLLTVASGSLLAENWGIANGYWYYHDLPDGRTYPYWLPFAWALAFGVLYRVEERVIHACKITRISNKLMIALFVAMIIPAWGEMVVINLGVWTYTWGWQLFGVPALAVLLLIVLHLGVFLTVALGCKLLKIEHPIFAPNQSN